MALRPDFTAAQLRQEADKADRRADEQHPQHRDDGGTQRAPRRSGRRFRRFIVELQAHAKLVILPRASLVSLERFKTKWSPHPAVLSHKPGQSMSSSVGNSVRREAQAVIAATMPPCAASTR